MNGTEMKIKSLQQAVDSLKGQLARSKELEESAKAVTRNCQNENERLRDLINNMEIAHAKTVERTSKPEFTFRKLQVEQREWAKRNFGDGPNKWRGAFMGVVEEVGELSHALLKQEQGIRGTWEEHEEEAKDAVGDIIVYLSDLCTRRNWSLSDIIEDVWSRVSARDWINKPVTGGE